MALQWEECRGEYRSKHALYFRLRQEIQDTNIKVKGLQQVRNSLCVMGFFCICTIFDVTSLLHKMCLRALFGVYAYFLVTCSVCQPSQSQCGCISHHGRLLM